MPSNKHITLVQITHQKKIRARKLLYYKDIFHKNREISILAMKKKQQG
jgi:hypothetical protein